MIDFKSAALIGGVGVIGTLWAQVKQFFARIYSFAVVSVEIQGDADTAVMAYLWKHMKCSRFGERKFTGMEVFIKPKDRTGKVAYEMMGKSVTFFKGWRPIFLGGITDKNGGNLGGMNLSFIRGTYDIERLIADAIAEFDEINHTSTSIKNRYCVKKCFGRRLPQSPVASSDQSEPETAKSLSSSNDNNKRPDLRPIFWSRNDLGFPVSAAPFKNLIYDEHVNRFRSEIVRWKESEGWYKDKGLNWRKAGGILGPPGTGKTSFVRAIAQELDMPIHIYDLTTMDNEELCRFWNQSREHSPCIVLFEDIDRIFDKDKTIKQGKDKSITLDCLLNCIAGVEPANGILVFVTANDVSNIPDALGVPDKRKNEESTRPGRIDSWVYFGPLCLQSRKAIAERILCDEPDLIEKTIKAGEGETGAQFEARCSRLALDRFWGKPKVYTVDAKPEESYGAEIS